jgi:tRNA threonylcarbamoyladenosine biosynthesis protein TsaE
MGEPVLTAELDSEAAFAALAATFARELRARGPLPLVLGLNGDLGSGKTTWVRAMLRGLGHGGRVPSPTYTLLEQYSVEGLTLVHLDLYRLRGGDELEHLGLRDWLAEANCWIAVEWPERAPQLAERCDLVLEFTVTGASARSVTVRARTDPGNAALKVIRQAGCNNSP